MRAPGMRQAMMEGAGMRHPLKPTSGRRKTRIFSGWVYPKLLEGDQRMIIETELSAAGMKARRHYDDPANALHMNDVSTGHTLTGLVNLPVMVEHGLDKRFGEATLGKVTSAMVEKDGRVFVTGEVYGADPQGNDNELGLDAIGGIDDGSLRGLSLRWRTLVNPTTNEVLHKNLVELSLCSRPHYDNCVITNACSQPSSEAKAYNTVYGAANVKEVERILNLTMSAPQETTPAAATPGATPTPTTDSAAQQAAIVTELSRKLQAENERARQAASAQAAQEAKIKELMAQIAARDAKDKAALDAQKAEAIKPMEGVLANLGKHAGLDQLTSETAKTSAHVFAEPVVNPDNQLAAIMTACSAKLTEQEELIGKLTEQVRRVGNATSVAQLEMAASHAESLLNLVDGDRTTGKSAAGAADPMQTQQQQQQQTPSVFQAGALPESVAAQYGEGWSMPMHKQASPLDAQIAARNRALQYSAPVQTQPAYGFHQQQQQQAALAPRMIETAASAMTAPAQPTHDEAWLARVAGMRSAGGRSTFVAPTQGALPQHDGDTFGRRQ